MILPSCGPPQKPPAHLSTLPVSFSIVHASYLLFSFRHLHLNWSSQQCAWVVVSGEVLELPGENQKLWRLCLQFALQGWRLQNSSMAMPVETAVCIAHNVLLLLDSWIWTCVLAADEAARLLRSATHWPSPIDRPIHGEAVAAVIVFLLINGSLIQSHGGVVVLLFAYFGNRDSCYF